MGSNLYANYKDKLTSEEFIKMQLEVIKNVKKVLRGFIFWNVSYNQNARWEFLEVLYRIVKETGLKFLELIVWDKGHALPVVSKDGLTRRYEDILVVADEESIAQDLELYCLASSQKKAFFNKKTSKSLTNYWKIGTNNSQHANLKACFPVELPEKAIKLMTQREDIVIEPFGGSGSTLIASERLNRKCFVMEIDPQYCQVIIDRWENYTGQKAVKVNGKA